MHEVELQYDVVVSFAGEDRATAERFASLVKAEGFTVFYDFWEKADLWGRNLYQHLADVYSKKARYCVLFISAAYAKKAWTRHEMQAAQERAFRENEAYILPVRIDDTALPGIGETVAYLDLRRETIEEVAKIAVKKLISTKSRSSIDASERGAAPKVPVTRVGKLSVKKQFTDQDRDDFLERSFEKIAKYFERTLAGLGAENPGYVGKFKRVNADHFTATVYRDGKNVAQCGIRLCGPGGVFTNQIVFSNDPTATHSMNEGVTFAQDDQELYLRASGFSSMLRPKQKDRMSAEDASELFWEVLTWPLQR